MATVNPMHAQVGVIVDVRLTDNGRPSFTIETSEGLVHVPVITCYGVGAQIIDALHMKEDDKLDQYIGQSVVCDIVVWNEKFENRIQKQIKVINVLGPGRSI